MGDPGRAYDKIVTGQTGEHMPVTAKLSREFYEKFGDKIADELVNWFNQVDATYRSEFKDLFKAHFSGLEAKLEQRFTESDARWERRVAELKTGLILWMFGFWTASTFIMLGTTLAILKL